MRPWLGGAQTSPQAAARGTPGAPGSFPPDLQTLLLLPGAGRGRRAKGRRSAGRGWRGRGEGGRGSGVFSHRVIRKTCLFKCEIPSVLDGLALPQPISGLIFRPFSRGSEVRRRWRKPCQCPRDPTSLGPVLGFVGQNSWRLCVWGRAPRSTGTRRALSSAQWVPVLPRDLWRGKGRRQPEQRLGCHLAAAARGPDVTLRSLG